MTNEPYVNQELLARVQKARLELPEYNKPWDVLEDRHLSQLAKQCEAFTETEFAAVIITALRNYPQLVMKIILDELEGKNHE